MLGKNLERRNFLKLGGTFLSGSFLNWPIIADNENWQGISLEKPFKLRKPSWEIFEDGSFNLITDSIKLINCRPSFDGQIIMPKTVFLGDSPKGKRIVYELRAGYIMLDLRVNIDSISIGAEINGFSETPHWFYPIAQAQIVNADSYYRQGFGFSGPSSSMPIKTSVLNDSGKRMKEQNWSYDSFMTFSLHNEKNTLAVGTLDHKSFLHRSTIFNRSHRQGLADSLPDDEYVYFESGFLMEKQFYKNEYIKLPDIHFYYGNQPFDTLQHLAWQIGKISDARQGVSTCYYWSSWNQYKKEFKFDILKSQLDYFQGLDEKLPFQAVLIGDGYCTHGDWLKPNNKWPGGHDRAAREIYQYGYKAGIWIAPFMVDEKSDLFKQHPRWLIKDHDNNPIPEWEDPNGNHYALDGSHPEVKKYIRRVFKSLRKTGYTFYKIDFMDWGYKNSPNIKRAELGKTSFQIFREICTIIREEMGEGSYWLSSLSPFSPMIGFADGMRISNNILSEWDDGNVKNMIQESFYNHYFNNILWQNDPDILHINNQNNSFTEDEKLSLALWNGILGSVIATSEDIRTWDKGQMDLFKFLEPRKRPSNALLPFWPDFDEIKVATRKYSKYNSWGVLFFNDKDEQVKKTFKISDIISENKIDVYKWKPGPLLYLGSTRTLEINLKPHQSLLFYFSKRKNPPPARLSIGGNSMD